MSFSYDITLPTDLDWVRFYVPDKVGPAADAIYQDEEINALIAEQVAKGRTGLSTKYFASAAALQNLVGAQIVSSSGLKRKKLDDVEIEWGLLAGAYTSVQAKIDSLLANGNRCLTGPSLMTAFGRTATC